MFFIIQKSIFVDIFFSFNPNRVMGINGGYFPAICRVCFSYRPGKNLRISSVSLLPPKLSNICFMTPRRSGLAVDVATVICSLLSRLKLPDSSIDLTLTSQIAFVESPLSAQRSFRRFWNPRFRSSVFVVIHFSDIFCSPQCFYETPSYKIHVVI